MANPIERAELVKQAGKKAARIAASAGLVLTASVGIPTQKIEANEGTPTSPSCGELDTTKPVILGDGLDSTRLQLIATPECASGLIEVSMRLEDLSLLHDGQSTRNEQGFITVNLQNIGNNTFQTGEITYDPRFDYGGDKEHPGVDSPLLLSSGSLTLKYADGRINTYGVSRRLPVLKKNAPLSETKALSERIQVAGSVVNLVGDEGSISRVITGVGTNVDNESLQKMAQEIYGLTPGADNYDRIYFFSDRKTIFANPNDLANVAGAASITIKTDFSGAGIARYSSNEVSNMYGSQGRLKQVIPTLSNDYRALLHENNHLAAGKMSQDGAKLSDGSHYLRNVSAASPLGGIKVRKEPNGTLVSEGVSRNYMSPVDLYAHGWISADELAVQQPEIYSFQDLNQRFERPGTILTGSVDVITPQKLVEVYGPRIPGPEAAQRSFKDLFVVVSKEKLSQVSMTAFDLLAKGYEPYYNRATLGHSDVKFITPGKVETLVAETPVFLESAKGGTLASLDASFGITVPTMTTCVHYRVSPYNGDGPGVNMLNCDPNDIKDGRVDVSVKEPVLGQGPYIMLPGMTYTREARTTTERNPDINNPAHWTPWTQDTFRTPAPSTDVKPGTQNGISIQSLTPYLTWRYTDQSIFYSEVQVSGNTRFNTNPQTADSFVWWNLVHGGETVPPNSWATPPLEPDTTYYWRVRPRVQGDGKAVAWGPVWSFSTAPNASIQTQSVGSFNNVPITVTESIARNAVR